MNEGAAQKGEVKLGKINKKIIEIVDELENNYDSFVSPFVSARIDSNGDVFIDRETIKSCKNTEDAEAEAFDMYDDSWEECLSSDDYYEFLDYLRAFEPCSKAGEIWLDYELTYYEAMMECGA